jgi:hypothetical protein
VEIFEAVIGKVYSKIRRDQRKAKTAGKPFKNPAFTRQGYK